MADDQFILNDESLMSLWEQATEEEIGLTFALDNPADVDWLKQKLYQLRRDYSPESHHEFILHVNDDLKTVMIYRRASKEALK